MSEQSTEETTNASPEEVVRLHNCFWEGEIKLGQVTAWSKDLLAPPQDVFVISLGSPGGSCSYAAELLERLEVKRNPIVLIARSLIGSAAWGIFLAPNVIRLTYANTCWMQHEPTYTLNGLSHDQIETFFPYSINLGQSFYKLIKEGAGLTEKEAKDVISTKEYWSLGLDVLWLGERGLVDGVIFKEIDETSWVILTRQGFKKINAWNKPNTIKDLPLMTDEELEPFGLKQYVPTRPKRLTAKDAIKSLDYLTK